MKRIFAIVSGLFIAVAATLVATAPAASAAPGCPNVEVVWARGTVESAPPVGLTGLAYTEALRGQVPGKSVVSYGVPYAAGSNFNKRMAFAYDVVKGVRATQARVTSLARMCPQTHIVVGGYSQGAVVASYAMTGGIDVPSRYHEYAHMVPVPLPDDVGRHVAAVVLFAPPSDRWIHDVGAPSIHVAPKYQSRTVRYCISGDVVCDGAPVGSPNGLHVLYSVNGNTIDAARFTAARV
ncbi:cutinase family protein [Gordonia sp. TBRC 11910]|uniref:Cutinase n=1 Tax=Gordonia asplenii TaxID=2725283 RepID=A0A848KPC9_9ACTN|nr:cutinase family protein [Gordonia asplenii]NMO00092.1 cutinase family protein [Gordonia asplenii]